MCRNIDEPKYAHLGVEVTTNYMVVIIVVVNELIKNFVSMNLNMITRFTTPSEKTIIHEDTIRVYISIISVIYTRSHMQKL
jgi:hypothetical protein